MGGRRSAQRCSKGREAFGVSRMTGMGMSSSSISAGAEMESTRRTATAGLDGRTRSASWRYLGVDGEGVQEQLPRKRMEGVAGGGCVRRCVYMHRICVRAGPARDVSVSMERSAVSISTVSLMDLVHTGGALPSKAYVLVEETPSVGWMRSA